MTVGVGKRHNDSNHRAATIDQPCENARLRGSGALNCYPTASAVFACLNNRKELKTTQVNTTARMIRCATGSAEAPPETPTIGTIARDTTQVAVIRSESVDRAPVSRASPKQKPASDRQIETKCDFESGDCESPKSVGIAASENPRPATIKDAPSTRSFLHKPNSHPKAASNRPTSPKPRLCLLNRF